MYVGLFPCNTLPVQPELYASCIAHWCDFQRGQKRCRWAPSRQSSVSHWKTMKNIICWQVFLTRHHRVMVYTHLIMHFKLTVSLIHSLSHSLMHPLTRISRKLSLVCLLWCATWSEGSSGSLSGHSVFSWPYLLSLGVT